MDSLSTRTPWQCHSCSVRSANSSAIRLSSESEPICPSCQVIGFVEFLPESLSSAPPALPSGTFSLSPTFTRVFPFPSSAGTTELSSNRPRGFNVLFDGGSTSCCPSLRGANPVHLTREHVTPHMFTVGFETTLDGASNGSTENILRALIGPLISGAASFDAVVQLIMEQDNNAYGPPPASATVVNQLADYTISPETAGGDCAICQEDFISGDVLKRLSLNDDECPHKFHSTCILPWLRQHNSCPVCRFELPTDDEDYERRKRAIRERVLGQIGQQVTAANVASSGMLPSDEPIPGPSSSSSS